MRLEHLIRYERLYEKETNITSQIQQSDWERQSRSNGQEQQDAISLLATIAKHKLILMS